MRQDYNWDPFGNTTCVLSWPPKKPNPLPIIKQTPSRTPCPFECARLYRAASFSFNLYLEKIGLLLRESDPGPGPLAPKPGPRGPGPGKP